MKKIIALTAVMIVMLAGYAEKKADQPKQKPQAVLPIVGNSTGKVLIQTVSGSSTYLYTSYAITSIGGETVIVDPTEMPSKAKVDLKPVAILNTHEHGDHIDVRYSGSNKCQKLSSKKGEIKTNDFRIYTVRSSHSGDTPGNSNVLVVLEVDGLRIVHMGDIGQKSLTPEQLAEIGTIDVAFMQFENGYSGMTLANEKGFKIIEQLKPAIVIPTHYGPGALPVLEQKYGKIVEYTNVLAVSKADIPVTPLNVVRILNTHKYP